MSRKKEITITFDDYKEISTDAAVDLLKGLNDTGYVLFGALLCAEIATRLFDNDSVDIVEDDKK